MASPGAGRELFSIGYVPAVDGLRAIAVAAVIIFHLGVGIIPGGFVGVDIFFVISGFVVAASVLNARFDTFLGFLTFFYARRLLRIMPALLVCLFAIFLASALFIPPVWLSATNESTGRAAVFGFSNVVLALNSDTYFSPRAEYNPFTHTWSLGVEEQFYLVFPLLWFFWVSRGENPSVRRRVMAAIAALSIGSLILCAMLSVTAPRMAFYMIFARFWELGLGVLLVAGIAYWLPRLRRLPPASGTLATAFSLVLLIMSLWLADEGHFPFPWAVVPVIATGLLICAVISWPGGLVARALAAAPTVYIGRRSYSVYLWHWPIFVLLRWTVGLEGPVMIAIALAATLVAGMASYRFVEEPFRHSPRAKAMPRGRVVLAGLLCMVAASAVSTGIIKAKSELLLSVTRDTATWFPVRGLAYDGGCQVATSTRALDGVEVRRIEPDCGGEALAATVFVFGDSHAGTYRPLLTLLAARDRAAVEIFSRSGCGFFRLDVPNAELATACADFDRAAMRDVAALAKMGDVIFLPSLRMERFANQWGDIETSAYQDPDSKALARQRAVAEAVDYFRPLVAKGVRVVVEAPKPLFKLPPFRCSDWFNASNPVCAGGATVSRVDLAARAAPSHQAIAALIAAVPGIQVWDPFPVLCPDTVCSAYAANGKPLFFDGDHLSRYGNEVLKESFLTAFAAVLPPR